MLTASQFLLQVDALSTWLSKRLEAAHAAAAARQTGALGRRVDTTPRRLAFDNELHDVQSRADAQRHAMNGLYSNLFAARSSAAAALQVAEVMKACEERGEEIMADTSQISTAAATSLSVELGSLIDEIAKRHVASLATVHAESDAYERALVAPSVRELPKHKQLLEQLTHELEQSLQLALARPAEWFEILSRSLRLDEAAVADREERLRAATYNHAAELSAHSARAAEEVQAEEGVQARREKLLTAEASATAERIATERNGFLADRGAHPDLAAMLREAVETRSREGEEMLLERKRAAAERLDGPLASLKAGDGEARIDGRGGASLDGRRRTRGVSGLLETAPTPMMDGGLLQLARDHYHQLIAEATASTTKAAAVAAASGARTQLDWAEEAAEGLHGLSHAESDALHALEITMQADLKDAVLAEHATFASQVKDLAAQRDGVRLEANAQPPPDASLATALVGADVDVEHREPGVGREGGFDGL